MLVIMRLKNCWFVCSWVVCLVIVGGVKLVSLVISVVLIVCLDCLRLFIVLLISCSCLSGLLY